MRNYRAAGFGHWTLGRSVAGVLGLLLLGLTSCSGSSQPTGLDATHGGIAVTVQSPVASAPSSAASVQPIAAASNPPIDCVSLGIGVITVQAQDSGGTVRGSGDFACADHNGTLTGIPSGSGYRVTVIGRALANGPILLQGEVTGITVTPNSTSQAFVVLARIPWAKKNPENVEVSKAANNQRVPQLVSDGAGGAIIVWEDARSGSTLDIYAQGINASGQQ